MNDEQRQRFFECASRLRRNFAALHKVRGVSPGEFFMLNHIARFGGEEGLRAGNLGEKLGMSRPAVSQMLNSLEDKGFIERMQSRRDHRAVFVRLSEQGRGRFDAVMRGLAHNLDHVFDQLGREKFEQLIRLVNDLSNIAEQEARDMDDAENTNGKG